MISTKCTIIFQANNGTLEDYPVTETTTFEFDATDSPIGVWVTQFKKVLAVAGFAEKSIEKYLGDV